MADNNKAGTGAIGGLAQSAAADHLKSELQEYLAAQAQRLLMGAGRQLGGATVKLNDIAQGNSPGFAKLALDGGRKLAEGKGPVRSAVELGAGRLKDNVKNAFKGLAGGKGKSKGGAGKKPTVIMEFIDVGVDLRTAYDQWTQYQEFSTFAKGVKSANRADDTTSDWQLKIFWSNRSWKATTTEQVPDDRIQWTSEGAKGTSKGVISFHPMADRLTRVLLIIEYYPKGLFEKTGNIWRAQGRRARLDLKHFARFVTLRGEASDGWRGEIQDGEVVLTHEDALAQEEEAGKPSDEYDAEHSDSEDAEGAEGSEETGEYGSQEYEDEDSERGPEDSEPLPEEDEGELEDEVEEYESDEEPDDEPEPPARQRQRAGAGARR
ncbi:SRPBCC family protein [Streptomyces sp. NBC_00483]|uniref:SRPBCC family protein n=1 Tax=Streptomyces sp. NBC_00483 TaxID=2975756 RepID=UPI002E191634